MASLKYEAVSTVTNISADGSDRARRRQSTTWATAFGNTSDRHSERSMDEERTPATLAMGSLLMLDMYGVASRFAVRSVDHLPPLDAASATKIPPFSGRFWRPKLQPDYGC